MKVNEIFCSLQGEGCNAGIPMVFVRFSGCNLNCPFCDTQHSDGVSMSENEIIEQTLQYDTQWVVFTGGEPALQLTASLIDGLHKHGRKAAVETNGTMPLPRNVDWTTLSPKDCWLGTEARPSICSADELKVLYDGSNDPEKYMSTVNAKHFLLQPMDTGNHQKNTLILASAVDYVMNHPRWRLSLQIHKIIGIK